MEPPFKFCRAGAFIAGQRPPVENKRSEKAAAALAQESRRRACEGCGAALAARGVVGAALRATGDRAIVVDATGCLEVSSASGPGTPPSIPAIRSLAGNAAAVASGVVAGFRAKGRADVRVIAQGASGGIGFGIFSGMFDRDDDVLYVCYDSAAYMNACVARPGLATAVGAGPRDLAGHGRCLPLIALAHGIPYVATASVADLGDLERKVARAMGLKGARYLHVHVPCPLGCDTAAEDAVRTARLAVECGLFPLFEAEHGEITARTRLDRKRPVAECFESQRRRAGPSGATPDAARLAAIQAVADRNIARFGLLD